MKEGEKNIDCQQESAEEEKKGEYELTMMSIGEYSGEGCFD